MTLATPGAGSGLAVPDDQYSTGLEDIDQSDITIPRLKINHDSATFLNPLTNEEFDRMNVILLGLVKQRIMWHGDISDKAQPQCKSPDFEHGFPNMGQYENTRPEDLFPWDRSNFDPDDANPVETEEYSSNGHNVLRCASCIFAQWDQGGQKGAPPCNEQHTFPLLYSSGDDLLPALLTVQKTGIKPSRTYIGLFAAAKTPMYQVWTELSLTGASKGGRKYAIPAFRRGEATDREQWPMFGAQMRNVRSFIRSAPRRVEDDDDAVTDAAVVENTPAPAATPAPAPSAAKAPSAVSKPAAATPQPQASAPAVADDDDDLPF